MSFDTERFIREIKTRPALWNTSSAEYSDRKMRIKCWKEIVELFKEKNDMTILEKNQLGQSLQKKWKSIRGCFTRELSRQNILKVGSHPGPRKSEYMFYKQLKFLKNVVSVRELDHVAALTKLREFSQQNRELLEASCSKGIQIIKRVSEDGTATSLEDKDKYDINYQDEDKLFLLSLVNTLKSVPLQRKMATKIKIMAILDEATQPISNTEAPGPSQVFFQNLTQSDHQPQSFQPGDSTLLEDFDSQQMDTQPVSDFPCDEIKSESLS